jgi:hypothetical protein
MVWLYNLLRALARGLAAGSVGLLLNGKAEPFGLRFEAGTAVLLAFGLFFAAFVVFRIESWAKKRAGL